MGPKEAFGMTEEELGKWVDVAAEIVRNSNSPKEMIQSVAKGEGSTEEKLTLLFIATSLLVMRGSIRAIEIPTEGVPPLENLN